MTANSASGAAPDHGAGDDGDERADRGHRLENAADQRPAAAASWR